MIRNWTKLFSIFCGLSMLIVSNLPETHNMPEFRWSTLGLTLLFAIFTYLLQFSPVYSFKNSKNLIYRFYLKALYKNPFPEKLRLKMTYRVHLKDLENFKFNEMNLEKNEENLLKGEKIVEWAFLENATNRFVIKQTTDQAESIASCVGIAKTKSKTTEFYFEFDAKGKKNHPDSLNFPRHEGVMRVIVKNSEVIYAEYWNFKPAHGIYEPLKD